MFDKWQSIYSHAQSYPTPVGKDIGEAIEQGFNIREWLLKAIPDYAAIHQPSLKKVSLVETVTKSIENASLEQEKKLYIEQMLDKLQKKQPQPVATKIDTIANTISKKEPLKDTESKEEDASWFKEYGSIVTWYQNCKAQDRLPREQFKLEWIAKNNIRMSLIVPNPSIWYAALDREIAYGPSYIRALSGCLQNDLIQLKKFVEPISLQKEQ
jgi:hypothetical protein